MFYQTAPGQPLVVMTVEGTDPTLPSILLNSHTDVAPATKVVLLSVTQTIYCWALDCQI